MLKSKEGSDSKLSQIITKKGAQLYKIEETEKNVGYSSFSEEEKQAFTKLINCNLAGDEYCKRYLPIDPTSMDIFPCLKDGVILWFFFNKAS